MKEGTWFLCLTLLVALSCGARAEEDARRLVVLDTTFGEIVMQLFPEDAPITVANFLEYIDAGFYDGLIFHRAATSPAVIQGGRNDPDFNVSEVRDPIVNEFGRSNVRGTVAMAKLGGDPDSATSQFFVNLVDNSENLDDQNGGFTVFAEVIGGMDVVDAIGEVPTGFQAGLSEVPLSPPGPIVFTAAAYEVYCPNDIAGDYDGNCRVDIADLGYLARKWLGCVHAEEIKVGSSTGNARFGYAVGLGGERAIVGAPGDATNGQDAGAAHIFIANGNGWVQEAKILATDGAYGDEFGFAVDISGDYAIIGSPRDAVNGANSGSAYIFKRVGATWQQQQELIPAAGDPEDWFGYSVSISGDWAIVSAIGDDDKATKAGAVYAYKRNGSIWTMEQKIIASDGSKEDKFGMRICIDASSIIVGATRDDDNGTDAGAAYVFELDDGVSGDGTWVERQKLAANDGNAGDWFGYSVSISDGYATGEGNATGEGYAIVGAIYDDDDGFNSGSAYIFRTYGSVWAQLAKLTASDADANDKFGYSVAIGADHAVVGARLDDDNGSESGSAYVFMRDGANWVQRDKLTAADGFGSDWLGFSVAINGMQAMAGAYGNDAGAAGAGAAYTYGLRPVGDLSGDFCTDEDDFDIFIGRWLDSE